NEGLDTTILQSEADEMLAQIQTIVSSSEFNGINLLDNGTTTNQLNVVTGLSGAAITFNAVDASTSGLTIANLDLTSFAVELTLDNTAAFAATSDHISVTYSGETHIFEFVDNAGGQTLTESVDEANGVFVHAVTIDQGGASTAQHVGALADVMREQGLTINLADDGTISVSAGGDASLTIDVSGVAAGGITQANAGGGASAALTQAKTNIGAILTTLGTFSNRLESQAEFTQVLTDTLEEGLGILVDANLAEVSAKLQSEQTKEQLGIQSLSIANAASQSILGLFR
ncbi:MAG: flagellin, partial [Sneathiella sp.]|nr:flagellin [Sneathiella sp.]